LDFVLDSDYGQFWSWCRKALYLVRSSKPVVSLTTETFIEHHWQEQNAGSGGLWRVAEDPPSPSGRGQGEGSRFDETCDPHPALRAVLSQRERERRPILHSSIDRRYNRGTRCLTHTTLLRDFRSRVYTQPKMSPAFHSKR